MQFGSKDFGRLADCFVGFEIEFFAGLWIVESSGIRPIFRFLVPSYTTEDFKRFSIEPILIDTGILLKSSSNPQNIQILQSFISTNSQRPTNSNCIKILRKNFEILV